MDDDLNPEIRFRNRWIGYGFLALFCVCGGVILAPIYNSARPAAPRATCLSNLKQIAIAFAIYATDSDDRFPLSDWQDSTRPYVKNDDMLSCPKVAHDGYAMNTAWVAKKAPEGPKPLLFETDALGKSVVMNLAGRNRNRHDGKSNVAYTDTSARSVKENEEP